MSECQMKADGDGERNYACDFMGGMLYLLNFEVLPIPIVMALNTPAAPTTHRMPPIERRAITCSTKVPIVRRCNMRARGGTDLS
jgi:hypothetical protein